MVYTLVGLIVLVPFFEATRERGSCRCGDEFKDMFRLFREMETKS